MLRLQQQQLNTRNPPPHTRKRNCGENPEELVNNRLEYNRQKTPKKLNSRQKNKESGKTLLHEIKLDRKEASKDWTPFCLIRITSLDLYEEALETRWPVRTRERRERECKEVTEDRKEVTLDTT